MQITIDILNKAIDALPTTEAKEFAKAYAPVLLREGIDRAKEIFALWDAGNASAARTAILQAMTPEEFDADNARFTALDSAHAQANAEHTAWAKAVAEKAVGIVLTILLALVGL